MAWITAAATIGAAVIGGLGSAKAGASSKQASREQMTFQEWMSSSAHQRQVTDLQKAGLNPILSARYGGAQGGAGAQPGYIPNVGGAVASSAMSAYTNMTNANKVIQDTKLSAQQVKTSGQVEQKEAAHAHMLGAQANYFQAQTRLNELTQILEALKVPGAMNEAAVQEALGPLVKTLGPLGQAGSISKTMKEILKGGSGVLKKFRTKIRPR